jgi:hypothetical protein
MPEAVDEQRLRRNESSRLWRERNPEKVRTTNRRYYQDNIEERRTLGLEAARRWRQNNPASALMRNMRLSAKAKGLECSIPLEELKTLVEPMTCTVTGWPLRWDISMPNDELAPSPDRLDNSKGYVSGNVRIVAWLVNRMRGNLTDARFLEVCRLIAERNP